MERNKLQEHDHPPQTQPQPVDMIELISQDLPWEDLDVAFSEKRDNQLEAAAVTAEADSVQAEHVEQSAAAAVNSLQFDAHDLSLFKAFANSLPCVTAAPARADAAAADEDDDDVAIKAPDAAVSEKDAEDAGTNDLASDLQEEDVDAISLSSQMESIMSDLLTNFFGPQCDEQNENEEHVYRANEACREECSMMHSDVHEEQTEFVRNVNNSSCAGNNDDTKKEDVAATCSSVSVTGGIECGCDSKPNAADNLNREQWPQHGIDRGHCTGSDHSLGRQDTTCDCNDDDSDDDDMMTASQEWVYDNLHGHILQQHDEATRANSLRVKPPPRPPGAPTVAPDAFSRAIHVFSTKVELMELDVKLIITLLVDCPNVGRCCLLLDGYSPYELSPPVLAQVTRVYLL